MANINISITRDNGTTVTGSATVEDALLVDITSMLGSMIFDSVSTPIPVPPVNSP
jgi:hypothetical protein